MQTRNPLFDDLSRMATGALGVATGMREEVEARIRDQFARILAGMDVPEREEFEVVRAMAAAARAENEALSARIATLEAALQRHGIALDATPAAPAPAPAEPAPDLRERPTLIASEGTMGGPASPETRSDDGAAKA